MIKDLSAKIFLKKRDKIHHVIEGNKISSLKQMKIGYYVTFFV